MKKWRDKHSTWKKNWKGKKFSPEQRKLYAKAKKAWLFKNPRPKNKQGFTNMKITNMNFTTNCCIIIFILIVVFLFKKEIMNFLK